MDVNQMEQDFTRMIGDVRAKICTASEDTPNLPYITALIKAHDALVDAWKELEQSNKPPEIRRWGSACASNKRKDTTHDHQD